MSATVPRCGTCHVVLNTSDAVRNHYESDYHLHNVRLRVEGKRPLTVHEYKHTRAAEYEDMDDNGLTSFACKLCKKVFHSVQTLQAHVRSTAHLIKKEQRILARDSDAASAFSTTSLGSAAMGLHRRHNAKRVKVLNQAANLKNVVKVQSGDREEDVNEMRCIFCGILSDSMEANLEHMCDVHEFTVPLQHRCLDIKGLLAYLSRKTNGLVCLVCGEKTKSFASLEALRAHMREKNHERIILGPEYSEFYSINLADADVGKRLGSDVLELRIGDAKRTVQRREAEVPRSRKREAEAQTERRRAILAADQQALAVAQRERQEVMRVQNRNAQRVLRRQEGHFQNHQLKVNLRSNKLHPKGYDGEGQVN